MAEPGGGASLPQPPRGHGVGLGRAGSDLHRHLRPGSIFKLSGPTRASLRAGRHLHGTARGCGPRLHEMAACGRFFLRSRGRGSATVTSAMSVDPSNLADRLFGPPSATPPPVATADAIAAMLNAGSGVSDLIFSPGRPPQVERHGELVPVDIAGMTLLRVADTSRIARDIIDNN